MGPCIKCFSHAHPHLFTAQNYFYVSLIIIVLLANLDLLKYVGFAIPLEITAFSSMVSFWDANVSHRIHVCSVHVLMHGISQTTL